MRVLVVRLTALGDVARAAEAAWALAAAGHKVEWVVEEQFAAFLQALPFVENIYPLPRRRWLKNLKNPFMIPAVLKEGADLLLDLRDRRFAAAFDFQGNFRSGMVTFLSGARRRVGFAHRATYEAASLFYTKRVRLPRRRLHRVMQSFALLRPFGITPPQTPPPVSIQPQFLRSAEEFLYQHKALGKPLVVMHPGVSGFGAYKRWEARRYGELALRLKERFGVFVALTWAGAEYETALVAARASKDAAVVAPRFPDIRSLLALIRRASLLVAADTGPAHLAALLRTPTVTLFGPKDPQIYRPWGPGEVVTADVPCRPCNKRKCKDPICMRSITVDMVYQACVSVLAPLLSQ